MKLIAKKPCSFGGKKFYIGDEVPAGLVLNPNEMEKMGVLVQVKAQGHPAPEFEEKTAAPITVYIHAEEGDVLLELTADGLQSVFDALSAKAAAAEGIINEMTDCQALLLLNVTDSRKSIKEASENRAIALSAEREAAESEGEQ